MENMNEQSGMAQGMGMHGGSRWWFLVIPWVTFLMWLAAIVFVVLSWISVFSQSGVIWGLGPQWYIWNAVMFGILAIYGGHRKMWRRSNMCGCKPGCECKAGQCTC